MSGMSKIRVGVMRGGPSSEYEVSLNTGANVLKSLQGEKYEPIDIFIDRQGVWHIHGIPHEVSRAVKKVDVIFNAMHGEYGEDGKVQSVLDNFAVPYTGSRTFASALAMNKVMAKNFLIKEGIKTPYFKLLRRDESTEDAIHELFRTMPHPVVVKPVALGSSVGVSIVRHFGELAEALSKGFERSDVVLIEEYIKGREATCGVIDGFRGQKHYALFPIEIVPPSDASFFDYNAKYGGQSQEICPGRFSEKEKRELQDLAVRVHRGLNLRHYSRSDFMVHPRRGIYFLETNTLPGLTAESLLPKALAAAGATTEQFLDHVLTLALQG